MTPLALPYDGMKVKPLPAGETSRGGPAKPALAADAVGDEPAVAPEL